MRLFIILCFFVNIIEAGAQENPATKTFERVRELASKAKYEKAIEKLEILRDSFPLNKDYDLYLARLYGWNKNYSTAIEILTPIIEEDDFSEEAIKIMVNTQLWAENYEEVHRYSRLALTKYKNSYFKIQKAKAFEAIDRDKDAKRILQAVLKQDSNNEEARALQTKIFKKNEEHISLSYLITSFNNPAFKPWHLAHLEVKKNVWNTPLLARINYGNLFGLDGGLFELDAYPKINSKSYIYLNAGASIDKQIFPKYKGALEYFQSLNAGFEVSLGGRYLNFEETEVFLLNSGIAFTKNEFQVTYKPYLTHSENNWLPSHTLAFRHSNSVKESFLQLDLQYGTIPYAFITSNAFTEVNSLRVGLQYRFRISENIILQPVFMYEYEEYFPNKFRNRFNSQIITFFRFH